MVFVVVVVVVVVFNACGHKNPIWNSLINCLSLMSLTYIFREVTDDNLYLLITYFSQTLFEAFYLN